MWEIMLYEKSEDGLPIDPAGEGLIVNEEQLFFVQMPTANANCLEHFLSLPTYVSCNDTGLSFKVLPSLLLIGYMNQRSRLQHN